MRGKNVPWYGSHSYLNEYIRENRCKKIMEIGVYNGAREMEDEEVMKWSSDILI